MCVAKRAGPLDEHGDQQACRADGRWLWIPLSRPLAHPRKRSRWHMIVCRWRRWISLYGDEGDAATRRWPQWWSPPLYRTRGRGDIGGEGRGRGWVGEGSGQLPTHLTVESQHDDHEKEQITTFFNKSVSDFPKPFINYPSYLKEFEIYEIQRSMRNFLRQYYSVSPTENWINNIVHILNPFMGKLLFSNQSNIKYLNVLFYEKETVYTTKNKK